MISLPPPLPEPCRDFSQIHHETLVGLLEVKSTVCPLWTLWSLAVFFCHAKSTLSLQQVIRTIIYRFLSVSGPSAPGKPITVMIQSGAGESCQLLPSNKNSVDASYT